MINESNNNMIKSFEQKNNINNENTQIPILKKEN